MATISVLSYANPPATQTQAIHTGLKLPMINRTKCSPIIKVSNNNNNNNVNNNNNIFDKTNLNKSTLASSAVKPNNKRPYSVLMKKQKTLPLTETNTNIINSCITTTPTTTQATGLIPSRSAKLVKTLKRTLPEIDATVLCRASGGKSKVFPLPVAVARRNARERNRVKQVNNGFAALRDRIPEKVAEAFEAQGNGRGSVKKLSKVETLRMAVEYIRSLEKLLELEPSEGNQTDSSISDFHFSNESSYHLSDTSSVLSTLTPPPSDNISSGSFDESDCLLPDITIIEGHQYVRIPGTNTYQLLESAIGDDASAIYENDENIEPILLGNHQQQQLHHHLMLEQPSPSTIDDYATDIGNDAVNCYNDGNGIYNTPIHILTPASISPGAYSGQSSTAGLSPAMHDINSVLTKAQTASTATVTADAITTISSPIATLTATMPLEPKHITIDRPFLTTIIKNEIVTLPTTSTTDSALYLNSMMASQQLQQQQYEGILTLKTRIKEDIDLGDDHTLSEESMLEAMNWWHSQHNVTDQIIHES